PRTRPEYPVGSSPHESETCLDGHGAHLGGFTAQPDADRGDGRLETAGHLLRTGTRLGEGDQSLRTQAEPGEAERTYHKVIARDVLPFGVRLKRCLAPLHGRFGGRLLSNGSGGRDHQEYGEGDNRETDDDEQDE